MWVLGSVTRLSNARARVRLETGSRASGKLGSLRSANSNCTSIHPLNIKQPTVLYCTVLHKTNPVWKWVCKTRDSVEYSHHPNTRYLVLLKFKPNHLQSNWLYFLRFSGYTIVYLFQKLISSLTVNITKL